MQIVIDKTLREKIANLAKQNFTTATGMVNRMVKEYGEVHTIPAYKAPVPPPKPDRPSQLHRRAMCACQRVQLGIDPEHMRDSYFEKLQAIAIPEGFNWSTPEEAVGWLENNPMTPKERKDWNVPGIYDTAAPGYAMTLEEKKQAQAIAEETARWLKANPIEE